MPTETGISSQTIFTESDLLQTYGDSDAQQTVNQYRQAHRHREENPNRSRASIAREVGRSPSVLRDWLVEGVEPIEIHALTTAKQYGWIPLSSDDRIFEAMNQLFAWIFSGGWINPDTYQPSLTVNSDIHQAVASHVLTPLGIEWRSLRGSDTNRPHELRPREGGAILGRLLFALGAPRGRKTEQPISLPSYLDRVGPYHRRQFARMYLLHRGAPANEGGYGLTVQEKRDLEYFRELRRFFETVVEGEVSITESLPKLYLSPEVVQSLAGANGSPKHDLAYRLVYGEDGTLVTERNFVNTYDATYSNPWTVVQKYREAIRRWEAKSDISKAQLSRDLDVSYAKLRSWLNGGKPYALNGVETARSRGWIGTSPSGTTLMRLNRLVAWAITSGYLDKSNMHPRFFARTDFHHHLLDKILDELDIDYTIQKDSTYPEVHPRSDGAVLGRVLHILGVPLATTERRNLSSLPVYLQSSPEKARREFVLISLLNQWVDEKSSDKSLVLQYPSRPPQYLNQLSTLIQSITGEQVTQRKNSVILSTQALNTLVPNLDASSPTKALANALGV